MRAARHRARWAAAVVLLAWLAAIAGAAPPAVRAAPAQAPAFHLPLLSSGTISLADFKGKPVVLLFWAPW
jgi:AhpC/TSA family protein